MRTIAPWLPSPSLSVFPLQHLTVAMTGLARMQGLPAVSAGAIVELLLARAVTELKLASFQREQLTSLQAALDKLPVRSRTCLMSSVTS